MRPKISVVIPSYNKVKFIDLTFKSIFDQHYSNLEVIIQDGGSTDGTVEIIKRFAGKYPLIWESKKDEGQLDAVNIGLKKATGDILAFINADDVYEKKAFNSIADEYLKQPNALWFAGRGIVINEVGNEIAKPVTSYKNLLLSFNSYFLLLSSNYLMQPSVFFTKKAFQKYGPFTGTNDFIMEYDFWLRLGEKSMPLVIGRNLSRFRIEPSTKTKRMYNELLSEDMKILKKYTKNPVVHILHQLNNLGRYVIGRFV